MTQQPGRSGPDELDEHDWRSLLELSGEQAAVMAPDGTLVWSNGVLARRLGRAGAGPLAADDVHPDDRERAGAVRAAVGARRPLDALDVRYRAADGRMWSWRWRVEPAADGAPAVLLATELERIGPGEVDLEEILRRSSAAIFAKDLDGRYLLVNDAFLDMLGAGPAAVVGATAGEVWPDRASHFEARDAQVLRTGRPETYEEHLESAGGTRTVLTTRFPLTDDDGRVSGVAGVATDITDRTEAAARQRERQTLLEAVLRATPDLVAVLDRTGRVLDLSEAAGELLGLTSPDVDKLAELVHPDDLAGLAGAYRQVLTEGVRPEVLRYRVRRAGGGWAVLETRGGPVLDRRGSVDGAVVVSRDVTAELVVEHQLRQALADAEAANRAKSDSLSRLSHDLRTPLNSVLGFAQLLAIDDLTPAQHEAVDHILQAGRHLLGLIDEVIDVSKIEAGAVEVAVSPVSVRAVAEDARNLIRPLADQRGVQVTVDLGPPDGRAVAVRADRQRLLQVLLNLLSNGVKYNRPGGQVVVRADPADDQVAIHVADTGPGIEPASRARLFQPFERLGAEGSGVQGTGVGLSLSKQLVEQMGGRLSVQSEVGAGSTFTVTLPAATPRQRPPVEPAEPPVRRPEVAARVLLVEDNADNLALVRVALERHGGVEVDVATTGADAVAQAQARPPDLILLDVHLPDMPGDAVLDRLDRHPATADIPVAVVTADATADARQRLRRRRVAAYLTKPIDLRHLLIVVDAVRPAGTEP